MPDRHDREMSSESAVRCRHGGKILPSKGGNVLSIEGEQTGEWVLVDLGDMIVHIMQPAIRAYYRLEETSVRRRPLPGWR